MFKKQCPYKVYLKLCKNLVQFSGIQNNFGFGFSSNNSLHEFCKFNLLFKDEQEACCPDKALLDILLRVQIDFSDNNDEKHLNFLLKF